MWWLDIIGNIPNATELFTLKMSFCSVNFTKIFKRRKNEDLRMGGEGTSG
jgi:hypothetical protein